MPGNGWVWCDRFLDLIGIVEQEVCPRRTRHAAVEVKLPRHISKTLTTPEDVLKFDAELESVGAVHERKCVSSAPVLVPDCGWCCISQTRNSGNGDGRHPLDIRVRIEARNR